MRVSQSLGFGLHLDLQYSVSRDLPQFFNGGLIELDLSQVVFLDPRDRILYSMG